jgi:hypothetical protein
MKRIRDVISKERPEILEGIANDLEKAEKYVSFLISTRHEIPEMLLNAVSHNPKLCLKIAVRLSQTNKEIPENILNAIYSNSETLVQYVTRIPEDKITTELLEKISKNINALRSYLRYIYTVNINLPITDEMLKKAAEIDPNFPEFCYNFAKMYINNGKKYGDINPILINTICSVSDIAERFGHVLLKITNGRIPDRIKNAIKEPERLKKNWYKGGQQAPEQNYGDWYRSRNENI